MIGKKIRSLLTLFVVSVALALGAYVAPVSGEMVATEGVAPVGKEMTSERARVKELVSRPDVAKKLETLGVLPKDAAARVDALTEEEVRALAARIDALPAGGMSDTEWLAVILIVILIVLLI